MKLDTNYHRSCKRLLLKEKTKHHAKTLSLRYPPYYIPIYPILYTISDISICYDYLHVSCMYIKYQWNCYPDHCTVHCFSIHCYVTDIENIPYGKSALVPQSHHWIYFIIVDLHRTRQSFAFLQQTLIYLASILHLIPLDLLSVIRYLNSTILSSTWPNGNQFPSDHWS